MSITLDTFKVQPGWIMAGKAVFTVSNGHGEHYTYKVVKKENEGHPRSGLYPCYRGRTMGPITLTSAC